MQDKYKPYERPERPVEPPEYPTIPEGESGYYNAFSDEFVGDEFLLDYIGDYWDLQPNDKIEELKAFLIRWMFGDWERIRGE